VEEKMKKFEDLTEQELEQELEKLDREYEKAQLAEFYSNSIERQKKAICEQAIEIHDRRKNVEIN